MHRGKCGGNKGMKILLTGCNGYIGTVMVSVLQISGYDVVGLDTDYYASGWLYGEPQSLKQFIKKDIREVTSEDMRGMDAVIHLGELSNDPLGQNDPGLTMDINHRGTVRLIDAARAAGVKKFIYSSSCSVYGASDNVSDETSTTNPLTAYAKSKVLNEQYLLSVASDVFTPVIMRNATVYGPSPRMRFDLAVNNLSGLAYTIKVVKMDSDGTPWRPFIHILDVCDAFVLALTAPIDKVRGQIMNVGDTSSNYQIRDIAEIVGKVFEVSDISLNKVGVDKRNYRVNFDKINELLGFTCTRDVEVGARELREIFNTIQMNEETFRAKEYTRLKMIDHLRKIGSLDSSLYWS